MARPAVYCRHAARRLAQAALRGTADPLGFRLEPRGPPARRERARFRLGRGRNLEPRAALLRAPLLVAEGRPGAGPLRDVPHVYAGARVRARERPPGAGP